MRPDTGAHRIELDGPRLPAISRIAKALLPHRDEVFRLTDVVGNSAYLYRVRS